MLGRGIISAIFFFASASGVSADCILVNQDPGHYRNVKGETDYGAMQDEVAQNNGIAVYGAEDSYNYIKNCPDDIRRMIDTEVSCQHFAGEFSGDGSERDKEVSNTLDSLGCDKPEFNCRRYNLLDKYKGDKTTYNTILSALKIIYGKDDYNKTEYTEKLKCQKY